LKRLPEQKLIDQVEQQISQAREHIFNRSISQSHAEQQTRAELESASGYPNKMRYYYLNRLIAVDQFDLFGLVRRDILDPHTHDEERPRVEMFYSGERLIATKVFDNEGHLRTSTVLYLPLGPMRNGY
jgi:hypothetical protein